MSNTYNASSTRGDDRPYRPLPWRSALALLLLLVAVIYLLNTAPATLQHRQVEQRQALLPWAGVIAEDTEQAIFEADTPNLLATLSENAPPVFAENRNLAFVRYWNRDGEREATLLQRGEKVVALPNADVLPEMGGASVIVALAQRAKNRKWTEPISHLQAMLGTQSDLTKDLDYGAKSHSDGDRFYAGLYSQQFEVLELAKAMRHDYPQLADAIDDMSTVLDALERRGEDALSTAAHASDAAETGISQVLEAYRARVDATGDLPEEVTGGWLPSKGLRVLVPLFTPTADEQLIQPAGYIELVFRDTLAGTGVYIARRCWPATAAVGLAVLLMLSGLWKPRRKERTRRGPTAASA